MRGEVSGYHEMENWRNVGYFPDSIQYATDFLAKQQTFAVIDVGGILWFEDRILRNPSYEVSLVATYSHADNGLGVYRIWLVRPRRLTTPRS